MRYRMFLLLGLAAVTTLGMVKDIPAEHETSNYNLRRTEIRGVVQSVDDQEAYIQTDDGEMVGVQLGDEEYWDDHDYYLDEGQYVEMECWYDPYDHTDWYFAGEIWGPGFRFFLTNNYGVPYWVIMADDYYYGLGYRSSCISYMVWYDCPPVYFVYLMLPPPPPVYYSCYYGPRWYDNCSDWYYGDRYCSGGSYWSDARGYERPSQRFAGRRITGRDSDGGNYYDPGYGDNDRRIRGNSQPPERVKSTLPARPKAEPRLDKSRSYKSEPRKVGSTSSRQNATRIKSQRHEQKFQRKSNSPRSEQKYQPKRSGSPRHEQKFDRRMSSSRPEQKFEKRASAPSKERRMQAQKSERRERQYANRIEKPQSQRSHKHEARVNKQNVREQKSPDRVSKSQQSRPQQEKQYSKSQSRSHEQKRESAKRSSSGRSHQRERQRSHR